MLLAVDIGNTQLTLGLYDRVPLEDPGRPSPPDPSPARHWRLSSTLSRTADEFRLLFRELMRAESTAPRVDAIVLASVVPPITATVRAALEGAFPEAARAGAILEMDHATPLPVRNSYRVPSEVGLDRLANAVGAAALYRLPAIVVDLGTATTFDLVSVEREYLGGVIMPGPVLMAEALSQRTARLPRVAAVRPQRVVGATTAEALQSGLYWGLVGAIDRLIEGVRAELGWSDPTVVATGGDAKAIVNDSRYLSRVEPDLTLFGLAEVWRHQRLGIDG
jgi:type III pantothenate kinase